MSVYKPNNDSPQPGGEYRQLTMSYEELTAILGGEGPTGFAGQRGDDVIVVTRQYDTDTTYTVWANTPKAMREFIMELMLYRIGKPYLAALRKVIEELDSGDSQ